ncbi:hypothetical protein, partial [Streptomyces sp. NPDC089915]|uniref:hypothetical protein n=1 Tax=Streptomyces sp. NPDC089915 TaxID=3155186 RepID=UPI00344311BE
MTSATGPAPDPAERMLRFHRPEQALRHLGPAPDDTALAALFGLGPDAYRTRFPRHPPRPDPRRHRP